MHDRRQRVALAPGIVGEHVFAGAPPPSPNRLDRDPMSEQRVMPDPGAVQRRARGVRADRRRFALSGADK
jgi:hypothetical protein